jgi:tetrahydromethanopterin S-methyltransferase subunit B
MKRLINYLSIMVLAVILSSCSIFKERKKVSEQHHHYNDSVHTVEKITIREEKVKGDSTKALFNLDSLLKSGVLRSQDRFFTTEIRYMNGNLQVSTTIDSLTKIITDMERSMSRTEAIAMSAINSESRTKTKKDFTMLIVGVILFTLLMIVAVILFLYYQMKTRLPLV